MSLPVQAGRRRSWAPATKNNWLTPPGAWPQEPTAVPQAPAGTRRTRGAVLLVRSATIPARIHAAWEKIVLISQMAADRPFAERAASTSAGLKPSKAKQLTNRIHQAALPKRCHSAPEHRQSTRLFP